MAKIKHVAIDTIAATPQERHLSTVLQHETLHEVVGGGEIIPTSPPSGRYRVTNLYCVKEGELYKLVVEHEDIPV